MMSVQDLGDCVVSLNRFKAKILRRLFRGFTFEEAMSSVKYIMLQQGFGAGGSLASSGEHGVLKLISRPDPVVFDVGAHVGDYTGLILEAFPAGKVVAFEPSAVHFEKLRDAYGRDDRVQLFNFGLGESACQRSLYKDSEVSGLASFAQRRLDHYNIKMDIVEEVSVKVLDDVVSDLSISFIDLLKIDVEGFELGVLKGGEKSLRSGVVQLVQFEFGGTQLDTHTNFQDYFYFFNDLGMSIGIIRPDGSIHPLNRYRELYDFYGASNFVAAKRERIDAIR